MVASRDNFTLSIFWPFFLCKCRFSLDPPRLLKRNVDHTFVIQKNRNQFLKCINSMDPLIQFTKEETRQGRSLPFLDTLITPEPGRTLPAKVYRKQAVGQPSRGGIYMGTLQRCSYPDWALSRLKVKNNYKHHINCTNSNNKPNKNKGNNIYMVVPWTNRLSFKNICRKHGIQVHF